MFENDSRLELIQFVKRYWVLFGSVPPDCVDYQTAVPASMIGGMNRSISCGLTHGLHESCKVRTLLCIPLFGRSGHYTKSGAPISMLELEPERTAVELRRIRANFNPSPQLAVGYRLDTPRS